MTTSRIYNILSPLNLSTAIPKLALFAVLFVAGVCCHVTDVAAQDMQAIQALTKSAQKMQQQVQAGDHKGAAATMKDLMPRVEQAMGATNPNVIRMGSQYAVLLRNAEDYDGALKQCQKTLAVAKKHLPANHEIIASTLNVLGSIYRLQGDFKPARTAYEKSIKLLEQNPSATSELADACSNFGDLLSATGDWSLASDYSTKAYELTEKQYGPNHNRTALTLNNLGMAQYHLGDLNAAELTLNKALAAYTKLFGPDHIEVASSLNNVGLLYTGRGKYDQAADSYERALIISRRESGDESSLTAKLANNLGQLCTDLGQHEQAQELLELALKYQERELGKDHTSTAVTRHNLGVLFVDLKDYEAAKPLLEQAVEAHEKSLGTDHTSSAQSRAYLGMLETSLGDVPAAIKQFDRTRRVSNDAVWRVLPKLGTNAQRMLLKRTFYWTLYTSLSLANEKPDDQIVIDETAVWLANGKGIAEAAQAAAKAPDQDGKLDWVELDEVRDAIPEDGMFIDIVRQDMIDFDANNYEERLGDPHYVAWLIPGEGDVKRIDLGDAAQIDKQVEAVRAAIRQSPETEGGILEVGEIEATKVAAKLLGSLGDSIWKPIAKQLGDDTKRITISPDGALWLVPWAAVPVGDDASEFLIEQYPISLTPSGRELVLSKKANSTGNGTSAIFSNPKFDQSSIEKRTTYQRLFKRSPLPNPAGTRSANFAAMELNAKPLPGTAIESAAISPSLAKWAGGKQPVSYQGEFAMESIAKKLNRPRSVVFATHGFFVGEQYEQATNRTKVATRQIDVDPLSNCGLLLSGCNDPAAAINGDDGVLTGTEIAALNLQGTDLVVLSACETGVGRIEDGEGVAGLRRAFHLAGARSVASTLWQIPDSETARLMIDFFERLSEGDSKDDALRAAQIKRIESRRKRNGAAHPFFWAAFTISGS